MGDPVRIAAEKTCSPERCLLSGYGPAIQNIQNEGASLALRINVVTEYAAFSTCLGGLEHLRSQLSGHHKMLQRI